MWKKKLLRQNLVVSPIPTELIKLEENKTWLWRTVVGAIIVAAVTALAIIK